MPARRPATQQTQENGQQPMPVVAQEAVPEYANRMTHELLRQIIAELQALRMEVRDGQANSPN